MNPQLRIATLNAHMLWSFVNGERLQKIKELLTDFDIVAIQEGFGKAGQFSDMWGVTQPDVDTRPLYRVFNGFMVTSGLMVLANPRKTRLLQSASRLLPRGIFSDWLCPKSVMWSQVEVEVPPVPAFTLNVFNLHLQADYSMGNECVVIKSQLEALVEFVRATLNKYGGCGIVMGDFNIDTFKPFYQDMFKTVMPRCVPNSHFTLHPLPTSKNTHLKGGAIDHIIFLIDDRCPNVSIPTSVTIHTNAADVVSDHYMVSTDLMLHLM